MYSIYIKISDIPILYLFGNFCFWCEKKIFLAGNFCNRLAGTSEKAETFVTTLLELPGGRKLL
ncbi:hypothetical protein B5F77_04480 [Parabacteroides sp. An277]|nr:hypothetical protein B5F77_04480 [Parabacteroides sp. An277]